MAAPRLPFLQYMLQKGYITEEQAQEAVTVAKQTNNNDIGRVVLNLGFAAQRHIMEGQAQERGIPFADLDRVSIDSSTIASVTERLAKLHNVVPVRKDGTSLYLAMANVNNLQAMDDIAGARRVGVGRGGQHHASGSERVSRRREGDEPFGPRFESHHRTLTANFCAKGDVGSGEHSVVAHEHRLSLRGCVVS